MKRTVPHLVCGITLLLLTVFKGHAQDIHFSQFFEAPLLRNPALAGLFTGDLRFQAVYRNQWNSVTDAYQTGSLNGEYKVPVGQAQDFISMGGEILYDRAGTAELTSTHILPVFNYHKSLSDEKNKYLSFGFMGGLVQRSINRSKITTNSQFDGSAYDPNADNGETFNKSTYSYFDGSVGMSFNSQMGENNPDNNYFLGLAYHHFNQSTKVSFYESDANKMLPKWVASAGIKFNTNEFTYLTIHADYSKQGPYTETIGGLMYTMKLDDPVDPKYLINAGAMLRLGDAIIPMAKIEMRPFAVSVSYDTNISKLKTASKGRGGFEMGLSYQKFFEKNNTTKNATRCPRF